jgi:hypothetical protein
MAASRACPGDSSFDPPLAQGSAVSHPRCSGVRSFDAFPPVLQVGSASWRSACSPGDLCGQNTQHFFDSGNYPKPFPAVSCVSGVEPSPPRSCNLYHCTRSPASSEVACLPSLASFSLASGSSPRSPDPQGDSQAEFLLDSGIEDPCGASVPQLDIHSTFQSSPSLCSPLLAPGRLPASPVHGNPSQAEHLCASGIEGLTACTALELRSHSHRISCRSPVASTSLLVAPLPHAEAPCGQNEVKDTSAPLRTQGFGHSSSLVSASLDSAVGGHGAPIPIETDPGVQNTTQELMRFLSQGLGLATWNCTALFAQVARSSAARARMDVVHSLSNSSDIIALQETHGNAAD